MHILCVPTHTNSVFALICTSIYNSEQRYVSFGMTIAYQCTESVFLFFPTRKLTVSSASLKDCWS